MNELMARSLSLTEIAREFRDHEDPGVSRLAKDVYEQELHEVNYEVELTLATERAEEAESECESLKELLRDCLDELPNNEAGNELRILIQAAI